MNPDHFRYRLTDKALAAFVKDDAERIPYQLTTKALTAFGARHNSRDAARQRRGGADQGLKPVRAHR